MSVDASTPPHAVLVISKDGLVSTSNAYLLEVLDRRREEMYGKSVAALFAEQSDGKASLTACAGSLRGKKASPAP